MSSTYVNIVRHHAPFELAPYLVLREMADAANEDGLCWMQIPALVKFTRLSESSVYAALAVLIKAGWLDKSKMTITQMLEMKLLRRERFSESDKTLCVWTITPPRELFQNLENDLSVQKSVQMPLIPESGIPGSGEKSPESGEKSPESGKPPHPLIGENHHRTSIEPPSSKPPAAGVTGNGENRPKVAKVSQTIEQDKRDIVRRVFAHFCDRTERSPQMYTLTDARMKVGLARLGDCLKKTKNSPDKAEELMLIAVDALAASKFHMGDNERGRRYNDWTDHLFKSTDKLEKWLESEA